MLKLSIRKTCPFVAPSTRVPAPNSSHECWTHRKLRHHRLPTASGILLLAQINKKQIEEVPSFIWASSLPPQRNILFRHVLLLWFTRPTCRGFHLVPAGPGGRAVDQRRHGILLGAVLRALLGAADPQRGKPPFFTLRISKYLSRRVTLDERDFVSVERVGMIRSTESRDSERSRPLVVRLAHRVHRKQLLAAARVRRSATTAGLGLSFEERRLYVNKRMFSKVRLYNPGSLGICHDELLMAVLHHSVDILAINETWLQLDEKDKASIYPAILSEASPVSQTCAVGTAVKSLFMLGRV
ncbi:hypothetical protein EVAR_94441_1 [Eumeta japonica]|uniref:Uncharacterized protein n=1 Tax=Eumeta variegata TaxID=151549 RepID=A0A4C1TQ74_EUMVA|nr:hypothetical protein EVAR_94441_1 [Eumeta japonica]